VSPDVPACYAKLSAARSAAEPHGDGTVHRSIVRDGVYVYEGWTSTHQGGASLLMYRGRQYCVVVSGGGVLGVDGLVEYGVPRVVAERLQAKLDHAKS
jgi:hypothetical protein